MGLAANWSAMQEIQPLNVVLPTVSNLLSPQRYNPTSPCQEDQLQEDQLQEDQLQEDKDRIHTTDNSLSSQKVSICEYLQT